MHNQFTQASVWGIHRLGSQYELGTAGVLFHQAQSKLVILKQVGAEIPHGHSLAMGAFHQTPYGRIVKNNFDPVLLPESRCPLSDGILHHFRPEFFALGHQPVIGRLLGLPEHASNVVLATVPGVDLTGAAAHRGGAPLGSART